MIRRTRGLKGLTTNGLRCLPAAWPRRRSPRPGPAWPPRRGRARSRCSPRLRSLPGIRSGVRKLQGDMYADLYFRVLTTDVQDLTVELEFPGDVLGDVLLVT